ncbi:hypothetical protein D3C78_1393800 [compost metagenome]
MSQAAITGYSGLVEVCIMKASLKRPMSSWRVRLLRTCTMDACENAASSLWVEWVVKTMASCSRGLPLAMP